MNMRAEPLSPTALPSNASISHFASTTLAPASIVPLADGLAAVFFDAAPSDNGIRQRLIAYLDGVLLAPPVVSSALDLRGGGVRYMLLLARPAAMLAKSNILLFLRDIPKAANNPDWLQSPLRNPDALIEGLSNTGRRRLLKLYLTTGTSLIRGFNTAFCTAAHHLLDLLGAQPIAPVSCCSIGSAGRIFSFPLRPDSETPRFAELVALGSESIIRLRGFATHVTQTGHAHMLHVHLPDRELASETRLVAFAENTLQLALPNDLSETRPLARWLARADTTAQAWAEGLVAAQAPLNADAALLLRELRHSKTTPPVFSLRHLSGTRRGLLVVWNIDDHHDLVRALRVERAGIVKDIALNEDKSEGAQAKYLPLVGSGLADDACRIRLVFGSGRVATVHEGPITAFCGKRPSALSTCFSGAAESLARARLDLDSAALRWRVENIGVAVSKPCLSLVIDVGDDPDLVRARAAMLFREPASFRTEIIYYSSSDRAAAAHRVLEQTNAIYGLACRILTFANDATPAQRLFAALNSANADARLVMGADILPATRGWLADWRRALGQPGAPRLIGGVLLARDGSVCHAGGKFALGVEFSRLDRRFQGLPEADLPRGSSRATMLVPHEAFGITRSAWELLRAFTTSYSNPDILLAYGAWHLAKRGVLTRTALRGRFIRFGASAAQDPVETAADAKALAFLTSAIE